MRRKLHIIGILLVLICTPFFGLGQKASTMHWGPVMTDQKGNELLSVFGADSAYFYTLRTASKKRDGFLIEQISTDSLAVEKVVTVQFPMVDGMFPLLFDALSFGGRNYLITTAENATNNEIHILAFELNTNLMLLGSPITIGISDQAILGAGKNFMTYTDKLKRNLLVVIPKEKEAAKNEKFDVLLFDADLNFLYKKSLELPHASGLVGFEDILVDAGRGFFLLTSIVDKSLKTIHANRNMGRNYSLLQYTWENELMRERSLAIGTKWLYNVKLIENAADNFQIAGYFSNMVDLIMAGTFSVEIDRESGEIVNQGLNPFDREFKNKFKSATNNDPADLGLYRLDHVYPVSQNRTQLVSEKRYSQTSTVFNPATGTYSVIEINYFDQLLITGMSPSSEIIYQFKIPKFQSSSRIDGLYTSYVAWQGKSGIYLIYNDHERNAALRLDEESNYRQVNSTSSTQVVALNIDDSGQAKKEVMFTTADRKMTFTPYFFYALDDGIILMTVDGYKTQYVRLKLE